MRREEMRKKISEELKHIPRSFKGSDQNYFRLYYNGIRMTDLGRNPSSQAKDTLIRTIEAMKKDKPDFSPIYDKDFFQHLS